MTKVLCIEDEADFREAMIDYLDAEGYETCEAQDGEEGIHKILEEHPDVVLCDINMPKMSGYEVLSRLRELSPEKSSLPFVFLSALAQNQDRVTGMELGADDYLIKPVDFDVLHATIRSKLQQMQRMQRFVDQSLDVHKSNLLHMLSHELNTPLHNIISAAELAKLALAKGEKQEESGKALNYLTMIHEQSYELRDMIDCAIETSALISGHITFQESDIDLEAMLYEVTSSFCHSVYGSECVRSEIEVELPLVRGDQRLLSKGLSGLIKDCLKYREEDRPVIFRADYTEDNALRLRLEDGGTSLAKRLKDAPLLFADNSSADRNDQLRKAVEQYSLSYHFAQMCFGLHEGSVTVHIKENQSLVLTLRLPAHRLSTH